MDNHPVSNPDLILGTAMWGWTTERKTAFALLDTFYAAGFRQVDGATNYPINKNPDDFRMAENILLEWIAAHQVTDLKVIMKVGSLDNLRSPDHNLSKSFLLLSLDHYSFRLGSNLDTMMIHWDNRAEAGEITGSYEAMAVMQAKGIRLGLSGIRHPEVHAEVNRQFNFDFRIQIKHHLFYSDYSRYQPFHGKNRFIAYGINAGGIKLDQSDYRPEGTLAIRGGQINLPDTKPVKEFLDKLDQSRFPERLVHFNQLGMIYAFYSPDMEGILIGPSRGEQLNASLDFYGLLKTGHYGEVYEGIVDLLIC